MKCKYLTFLIQTQWVSSFLLTFCSLLNKIWVICFSFGLKGFLFLSCFITLVNDIFGFTSCYIYVIY